MTTPSPCISVCKIAPAAGWCLGCRRTIAEIKAWKTMTDDQRRQVADAAKAREVAA
jgi:predicted Fe-S protein YdhL (DUF1289 family)